MDFAARSTITPVMIDGKQNVRANYWNARGYSSRCFGTVLEANAWIASKRAEKV